MNSTTEKANILIVDDNLSLLKTLSFILHRKGYAITLAENGMKAIELARKTTFDLIFTDIKMPDLDGVETFRRIKADKPEARVVMMTAYAVDDLIGQAIAEGAYGVIYKPVDIDTIVSIIEKTSSGMSKGSILVVDDDQSISHVLKKQLEMNGYDVEVACSGEEAIFKARRNTFNLSFIDIVMPGMNGIETLTGLKKILPDLKAVLMTGYIKDVHEIVDESILAGAYTCMMKPFKLTEVLRLAEEIIGKCSIEEEESTDDTDG